MSAVLGGITPPADISEWATWLGALVVGLGAIGWLGRKTVRVVRFVVSLVRRADALLDLADHELRPNSGSSIKDAADRIPALASRLDHHIETSEADRQELRADLQGLTQTTAELVAGQGQQDDIIRNLSEALPLVARSTPPPETTDSIDYDGG